MSGNCDQEEPLEPLRKRQKQESEPEQSRERPREMDTEEKKVRGRPASITLYGGFAKIEHKKYYGPDTIEKGKRIVDHVANIREVKEWNQVTQEYDTVITATCIREMNITNCPYSVRLMLNKERQVTDAFCGAKVQPCPTGGQGNCKHVAATVDHVNQERTTSKTDESQAWLKPSDQILRLYPKGETVQELFVGKKGEAWNFKPNQEKLEHMANLLKKHNLTSSSMYKSVKVDKTAVQTVTEERKEVHPMIIEMLGKKLQMITTPDFPKKLWVSVPPNYQTFYMSSIDLMPGEAEKIFKETLGQSVNKRWYEERANRITASTAHRIAKANKSDTRIVYMYPELAKEKKRKISHNHKNFRYGRDMEPKARAAYEEIYNAKVHEAGLVVCPEQPWLACSPDGFIIDEVEDTLTLLEIKCPISCRNQKIKVDYLEYQLCPVEGTMIPKLKTSSEYFLQVQLQLYLCKAKKCHFFVFSTADQIKIDIDIDTHFL